MIIVFQTYQRTAYALATIAAIKKYLDYPVRWLVVDDGSGVSDTSPASLVDTAHVDAVCKAIGDDLLYIHSERIGYGALANIAWRESAKHDPITLWLEDDWILQDHFDPSHYIEFLQFEQHIGMVRLARIPIGLHSDIIGDGAEVYLRLKKGSGYYFSGNPSIRHVRFYDVYGNYPEGLQPGDTEVEYDRRIQGFAGPDIIFPVNVGTWGLFGHIGTEKSY